MTTPRGMAVEVLVDKPEENGPFPGFLGSGSHYDMCKPILAK